jgi:hypothetical protein
MLNTVRAVVRKGKIEVVEPVDLPEGTTVLVTVLTDDDTQFWSRVSQVSLDAIWDNAGDDVYAELLKE